MQFNSINFMIFLPIVMIVYFLIPRKLRSIWLLIASYFFYMSWNPKYAMLIIISTLATYWSAIFIRKCDELSLGDKKKKIILISCIILNLLILVIFKYTNFLIDILNGFTNIFHITLIERKVDILLPVGISFYTFQALGYIIDVYKKNVRCEKNFIKYALFVSFFPQLVAGPIERSKNLLNKIRDIEFINIYNYEKVKSGFILILWGLFMKMVIADRVAILVDNIYNNFNMSGGTELIIATLGFALQIYCDFNSYSTIAIGSARIFGFDLMENFNTPYFALSIRDFWRRWHISLSSWFKDYLYIPLGGSKVGIIRKYINIMIVFILSGLWHGADMTFVIWGGLHGAYQVVADALKEKREYVINKLKINTSCFSWKLIRIMLTFTLVTFAWIFFRAENMDEATSIIFRIILKPNPWILFNDGIYGLGLDNIEMNILLFSIFILLIVDIIKYKKHENIDSFIMRQNMYFEWGFIIFLILMIFIYGEYGLNFDPKQFIYFQF